MNTLIHSDPFAPAHIGVASCFCGNPTVADHEFYFCSPDCARADAMRALGEDDCHYRKVVRKAYVHSGAPEPSIYRRKSEDQLHQSPSAKRISGILPSFPRSSNSTHQHNEHTMSAQDKGTRKEKVFPTLAQVTGAILGRKARINTATTTPLATAEISLDVVPLPLDAPPQKSRAKLGPSASPQLRNQPQQTMTVQMDKKIPAIRRQSSMLQSVAEEVRGENLDYAGFLDRRTDDRPISPHPEHRIIPCNVVEVRRSNSIRRAASFAGWHVPAAHFDSFAEEGESLMQLFNELCDVREWIEDSFESPGQD